MSFVVTIGNLSFLGRKGRKLLAPIQLTLSGVPIMPIVGPCVLQVSVATDGPFFFTTPVPGSWNAIDAVTVQSLPFALDPLAPLAPFTAFASFLYTDDLGPLPGNFSQNYSIQVIDTGLNGAGVFYSSTFPVSVTAEPALNKSLVFVLDRTATMATPSGPGATLLDRLKVAVPRGLELLTDADQVGAVTLDSKAGAVLVPLGQGSTTIAAAQAVCASLTVDTSFPPRKVFQTGLDLGRAQSSTATVLLVTDGVALSLRGYPSAQQVSPTSVLFIGTAIPPLPIALNNLRSSDGSYAISAPNTGEFVIEKLLSQILIDLGGGTIVSDPDGSLGPGESLSFPIALNETDRELQVIVFSDHPELLQVFPAPSTDRGHPKPNWDGADEQRGPRDEPHCHEPAEPRKALVARIPLAPLHPDHASPYHQVVVARSKQGPSHLRPKFTFLAAVQSDLILDARATASGFEVGAELLLSVRLTEYGLLVENRPETEVEVELRHPDGGIERFALRERSPGHFEDYRRTFRAGIYTARFIAKGRTLLQKRAFQREALRSVVIGELGASACGCASYPTAEPSRSS